MYTIPIISIKTNPDAGKSVYYRPIGEEYEYNSLIKYPQYEKYLRVIKEDSEKLTEYIYIAPVELFDVDKTKCVRYEFRQKIETIYSLSPQSQYIVKYDLSFLSMMAICDVCDTMDSLQNLWSGCINCGEEYKNYKYESVESALARGVVIDG